MLLELSGGADESSTNLLNRRSGGGTAAEPHSRDRGRIFDPSSSGDGPQMIWTSVQVLNVGNIHVAEQSFDARFNLECHWDVWDPAELDRARKVRAEVIEGGSGHALDWDPGLVFPSAISYEVYGSRAVLVESDAEASDADKAQVAHELGEGSLPSALPPVRSGGVLRGGARRAGRVGFRWRIGGTFKCSQDLRDFPFDKQGLRVVVQLGFEATSGRQIFAHEACFRQDPIHPNLVFRQVDHT